MCKTMITHCVYLSLGTNLGDRQRNIDTALALIRQTVGNIRRQSTTIETAPEGFCSDNMFLNLCLRVETNLTPQELLTKTQEIERRLGRTTKSVGGEYHDRIMDIDILLYDDIKMDEPGLKIPHPRMYERDFVMRPLMEILDS